MSQPSFLARKTLGQPNYFLIAMAVVFVVALMPRGARRAIESNTNKAEDWLPSSYDEAKDLRWFREHFIGEQFALLSWEGCTLGNPEKLQRLAKMLIPTSEMRETVAEDQAKREDYLQRALWYKRVVTGPGVLEELTSPPLSLSYGDAVKRIEGALVGPVQRDSQGESLGNESRTTCLIVYLSREATASNKVMRQSIERIVEIAETECGIAANTIHMGGPPVDNITIDIEGERTLVRLASLAGIVGLGLSYWCFRSMKLTSVVFAVGVISAGMSLAIVFYFGIFEVLILGRHAPRLGTVDAILMSMPAVVYVLGLSGAIHTVNYYRDARRESGLTGAAEIAVRLGWWPCTLAAFTTAVGLGSLYTSDILPIKKFGLFTALAVMATVGILFTVLPVFLHRFPIREELIGRSSKDPSGGSLPRWAQRLFGVVVDHHALTFAFWLVVMLGVGLGMTRIGTSVQLLKLLDEDARLIHDYAWLEKNLGNLVPMEVILTVPPERLRTAEELAEADGKQYRMTMLERLELMREIQRGIEQLPEISRVLSVATFTPQSTQSGIGAADTSTDFAKNKSLEEHREQLFSGDYLRRERVLPPKPPAGTSPLAEPQTAAAESQRLTGRELWRISARVAALAEDNAGVDYGQFVDELRASVDPVLLVYDRRDEVIRQLHQQGKQLRGGRFVLLYRSVDREHPLTEDSQEMRLLDLLRQSGADVKSQGVIPYNLANFDDPQQGSAEADQRYREAAIARLKQYDALILVSAGSDPTAHQLAEQGLTLVDVSRVLSSQERDTVTAAVPLQLHDVPRPIRAVYTGMVPLVYKTQRQLLISLKESIGWATLLIAGVMMLVLGSPMAGLISMIPNVFPIVIVFGGLGWLGIKVDIGIMMTASVALGVAVDDTIHYLTWFRRGLKEGLTRREAAMQSYERCATAMMQTTLIGGLGLAVFATSTFTPTQQFGYLMITMLGAALIGDLLLLPAILSGPLGRFFSGPQAEQAATQATGQGGSGSAAQPRNVPPPPLPAINPADAPRHPSPSNQASHDVAPTPSSPPTTRSDDPAESGLAAETGITPEERRLISEGPHAALHAKIRRLRRESAQDSLPS
jgi:predicted RND superfamily exporter protein